MRAKRAVFAVLLALCFGIVPALAQAPDMAVSSAATEALRIGGGDLLHISVSGLPELDQRTRVLDAGVVKLSLVGDLQVSGITPEAAARRIELALQQGGFILKPQVGVLIEESGGAKVGIFGQVQHPGKYPLTSSADLMDVLAMAGGLTPLADIRITVKRAQGRGPTVYAKLPNHPGDAILHPVMVGPGDLVIVPKAGIVYVLGDVSRPGGYVMQNDAGLTTLQAIALAGGTTKTASENHAMLVRQAPSGAVKAPLALRAMQRGQQSDFPLQPDDVIYVPYSTMRNMMLGATAILSSTSGAAIYAAH